MNKYVEYLLEYHKQTLQDILKNEDINNHYSINISFLELFEHDPKLGNEILYKPEEAFIKWDESIRKTLKNLSGQEPERYDCKNNVHFRVFGLPICRDLHRTKLPRNEDTNRFLQVSGIVVRISSSKMLEYQRRYKCAKCKYIMTETAEYDRKYIIVSPKSCQNPEECKSKTINTLEELDGNNCRDYQEIKIQEDVTKLGSGLIPNSMYVTLEDDLVDLCKPGDSVTICGIVKRRWGLFVPKKEIEIDLGLKANHIQINNDTGSGVILTPEHCDTFNTFWATHLNKELVARDQILKSFCPEIFGLYIVKLAMAVVLSGGSRVNTSSTTSFQVRSEPHLLLVGDPGTGKSQLLRFAAKIMPRSVLTTGAGSTAAGLTVTALMENGEWQLEAGALVLADGGVCCIDEFNSMKEHDRISIHEAMEQQTISVAKASIVCKLSTKCSILAAANPKGSLDLLQPLALNVALPSPLLSRFDLVLLIKDRVDNDLDEKIVDHILNANNCSSKLCDNKFWNIEMLQAYFTIIRKNHPPLTDDSNSILSAYYQSQRKIDCRNKARTTVRLLDSLVRLSQGHSRLMFHKQVEIVDAITAVILIDITMDNNSSILNLGLDMYTDFPENPMQFYKGLMEIVLNKLQLEHLLKKESENLDKQCFEIDKPVESEYFQPNNPEKNSENLPKNDIKIENPFEDINLEDNDFVMDEHIVEQKNVETSKNNDKKIKKLDKENNSKTNVEIVKEKRPETDNRKVKVRNKKKKTTDTIENDLDLLKYIPSVNDDFPLDRMMDETDFELDKDDSIEKKTSTNHDEKSSNTDKSPEQPEGTRQYKTFLNKFRFKKIIQEQPTTTIFQNPNDIDSLDLDL